MRITSETVVRGELVTLQLTEMDFCPECCGTLEIAGTGARQYLRCTSCYLAFKPKKEPENAQSG